MKTQPSNPHPTPTHHFTNFIEISYEKTRNSYDQCEVPPATHLRSSPAEVDEPPLLASPVRPNGRKWAEMTRISSFSAPESEALSQL